MSDIVVNVALSTIGPMPPPISEAIYRNPAKVGSHPRSRLLILSEASDDWQLKGCLDFLTFVMTGLPSSYLGRWQFA
jgi:hypothetical protein